MQYLGPKTTDSKEVVLFEDLLSSVTVFDTFALALASTGTRSKIVTNGHTTEGIGGATYTSTGTTGTPGTGNEALFYNADGTGYEIDTALGYVTIEQFGVVGGAHVVDQGAHVDEVAKLNAAMDCAANKKIGVRDETEKTVATAQWIVQSGCKYLDLQYTTLVGHGVTTEGIIRLGSIHTYSAGNTIGSKLDSCCITTRIDCLEKDTVGIYADGATSNTIKNCEIVGIKNSNQVGIRLRARCDDNTIENNTIVMTQDEVSGTVPQYGILVTGFASTYGGYFDVSTEITDADQPAARNKIIGNVISNGTDAITLTGAIDSEISDNRLYGQSRDAIHIQRNSHRNKVRDNVVEEYKSSGILVNYNSVDCEVADNTFRKTGVVYTEVGEASINIQLGAQNTTVRDNEIDSISAYGVFVGPGSLSAKVDGNDVKGYRRAGICVQSDYFSPFNTASVAHRTTYTTAPAGTWAKQDLEGVSIVNNLIGYGERESGEKSTALAFVQPGTTWELKNLKNVNNVVVDAAGIDYVIHYFEEQMGFLTGVATPVAADDLTPAKYVYLPSGGVQSANYPDYSTEIVSEMRNGTYIGLDDDHGIVGGETEFEAVMKLGLLTTRPTVIYSVIGAGNTRVQLRIDTDGTVRIDISMTGVPYASYTSTSVLPDLDPYTPICLKIRWESGTIYEAMYSLERERECSDIENWISLGSVVPAVDTINVTVSVVSLFLGSLAGGAQATSLNLYSFDAYTNNGLVAHVRPLWLNGTTSVRSPSGELVTVYTPEVDSTYEITRAYR